MIDKVVVTGEHAVREPVVAHELPDVFLRVEFGTLGGQRQDGDVVRHDEMAGEMPGGLIDKHGCVPPGRDLCRDFCQVEGHCLGVAGGQDEAAAFALTRANGAENIGGRRALVLRSRWPGASLRPAACDLVLLPDAGFIAEPDLYVTDTNTVFACAMFGCLIAATDPVSVIASFKEMKVEPRLSLLVEAESLLNDGTAAVGFTVLVVLASGSMVDPASVGALLLWKVLGGVLVGGGLAGGVLLLAGRTEDHLVEITLTTIIAYGSFLIAERLGASGVLASLAAGMVVGNIGKRGYISRNGRAHMLSFWEYAAFLANSIVFILIGLHEAHQALGFLTRMAAIAIALVLLGRAASVYLLCSAFSMSRLAVSQSYQHILVWGGLRGALALALAMTLPDNLAERSEMVVASFAVVAFSIFVQGLTMPLLIGWLGLMRPAVPKVK